ncbi:hypothetical protein LCGC14_1884770, partial [marine sediment metagenome]
KNPRDSSLTPEQLTFYDDGEYYGAIRNQPFFDEITIYLDNFLSFGVDNIYISNFTLDYDLRSLISQYQILSSLQMVVHFTNGAKTIYEWTDVDMTPGQFKSYKNITSLSTYRFEFPKISFYGFELPNEVQYGDFGTGWTYTENLVVDRVQLIHIDESSDHRIELDKLLLRVTETDEPNTFEDYLKDQKFEAANKKLTEFSITDSNFNKKVIDYTGDFVSSGTLLSSYIPSFTGSLSDYVVEDAFGKNTMSFNIKSNINYPNFVDGLNNLTANNIIKDFTIIPKLKPHEGEGLKVSTTYQYGDSWWHEQEFVSALPFDLTFSGISEQDISDNSISDIVLKVQINASTTNFDVWSWRPNLKIWDNTNEVWLAYEGSIAAYHDDLESPLIVWQGNEADTTQEQYDSTQNSHDPDRYFANPSGRLEDNCTIIFRLANDEYDFSDLLWYNTTSGKSHIRLLGLTYIIPGTFNYTEGDWDIIYEDNFGTNGRMSVSSLLIPKYSYARSFKLTDIIKKNINLSNDADIHGQEFENPLSLEDPWIDLNGQLGSVNVRDIARIVDVYGITYDPKIVVQLQDPTPETPVGNDFWRFNRTEKRLYLPIMAIINYEKFNFTMELWEDFGQHTVPDYHIFDVPNGFNNITIIENVIRDNGDPIEYFTKNFEQDYSFFQEEPYFISLSDIDNSVEMINFSNEDDFVYGDNVRGVVHDIGTFGTPKFEEKTNLLLYNTLKFPFAIATWEDSILLDLKLDLVFKAGFIGGEGISNEYDILFRNRRRPASIRRDCSIGRQERCHETDNRFIAFQ